MGHYYDSNHQEESKKTRILKTVRNLVLSALIVAPVGGCTYALTQTAGCSRWVKSVQSDFDDGLIRVVYVYSMDGELIAEYAGKFDVDYDSERIIFDDENGERHLIYFGSGSVVIDEISEEELALIRSDTSGETSKVYTYKPSNNQ